MKDVDVFYLNLGTAHARRAAFVAQYEACNFAPHWTLHRFHAIDAQHELVRNAKGSLKPGNKGCYFSSLECIRQAFEVEKHLYILDDDIQLCPETQSWVDRLIETMPEDGWDILLTDTIIPNAMDMPRLLLAWTQYRHTGIVQAINLCAASFTFCAGTTLINHRAKRKIWDTMMTEDFSVPWDLMIREHIRRGTVRAVLAFPYLTTVSPLADESQITPDQDRLEHLLYSEFRRMVWIGAKDKPYYSEWSRPEYRAVIRDEVVRLNAIMTPLLSLQLRWVETPKAG